MAKATIFTKGYWPLPRFTDIYFSGRWRPAGGKKINEKMSGLPLSSNPTGLVILEAKIGKALSKKIYLQSGGKKILLSRWFGGLYSNADTRSPRQVMEYYDAIASRYEFNTEPEREKQLETIAIHAKSSLPAHAKILDASAGRCLFAKVAGKHGMDVTSMDISRNMLGIGKDTDPKAGNAGTKTMYAGAKSRNYGSKVQGSIMSPPFSEGEFDCVVHLFSNLLSYDRKAFPKFHKILKHGGILVYLPVKSPGEQWLLNWREKTMARLAACGFEKIEKISLPSIGKKKSVLTFIQARKK